MPTTIVGPKTEFKNLFTKFGIEKNNLYRQMRKAGYVEIRERTLPNGSTVALGYKDSAKTNDIAFMLHPDLTMVQKTASKSHALLPWKQEEVNIRREYANQEGDVIRIKDTHTKLVGDKLVEKHEVDNNLNEGITSRHYNKYGNVKPSGMVYNGATGDVVKCTEKIKNNHNYCVLEHSNGQRTYIKNINGVNYTFTSK